MMNNSELLALVQNTSKRDAWRREALEKLVANLAIEELYDIVLDTSRKDSWREYALDAIREIAMLRTLSVSAASVTLSVRGASVSVNAAAVSESVPNIAERAADLLYEIVNDTRRKDNWRHRCLHTLIALGHKDYLERIANNTSRPNAWRNEAMQALIHG